MKKRIILIFCGIAAVILVFVFLGLRSRKPTSVEITAISPENPTLGESVRVDFRVSGGADDFSIVVLPDTQHYSDAFPETYYSQTQWIIDNMIAQNIIFVSHLGDFVQNNDYFEEEWQVADAAMKVLDGNIPYGFLAGNHDMQFGGEAQFYQQYFPESRLSENDWWGGSFNQNKNNYQLIDAAGEKFIFLNLQYCPPDAAIDWANETLANHADYQAILVTHSYLFMDGKRVGHCQKKSDGDNSGFDIWKKVVRQNPHIFLVLSGHIPGVSRREDAVDGRVVYQILSNYQDFENGGEGYLRIMTFQPNLDNIHVTTYSPTLDSFLTDSENQFDLSYDMNGGKLPTGYVTIRNGDQSCRVAVEIGYCDFEIAENDKVSFSATYSGDFYFKGSATE